MCVHVYPSDEPVFAVIACTILLVFYVASTCYLLVTSLAHHNHILVLPVKEVRACNVHVCALVI